MGIIGSKRESKRQSLRWYDLLCVTRRHVSCLPLLLGGRVGRWVSSHTNSPEVPM